MPATMRPWSGMASPPRYTRGPGIRPLPGMRSLAPARQLLRLEGFDQILGPFRLGEPPSLAQQRQDALRRGIATNR
jgi:hypothetical protein